MASKTSKAIRWLVRLALVAFVFGFMPLLVYKKACTPQKSVSLDEAYGTDKDKAFGADKARDESGSTP